MHQGSTAGRYFSITNRVGAIPELDGLRSIVILLVLVRHAIHPIYEQHGKLFEIGNWDVAIPLLNGWMGVDLFFVLSGFLITHHLLHRWPAHFNRAFMLRYWAKRILRTFPAYYAAVFIALFGLVPYFEAQALDIGYTLSVHLLFLQDYLGSDLVAAFWSLGVEEKFYLLCPLVLVYVRQISLSRQIPLLLFLALLPAVLRLVTIAINQGQFLNYADFFWTVRSPFHLAMDGLWIGVICALVCNNERARLAMSVAITTRICYGSIAILFVLMFGSAWFGHGLIYSSAIVLNLISLAFGALLLSVALQPTPISNILRTVWLRALSTISYSVYLLHLMLVPLALKISQQLLPAGSISPMLHFLAFIPVFFLLSIAFGCALHFAVEKPFLIFKDRIRI